MLWEPILTVKRSRSAVRVLAVLEAIARLQPVGVTTLARQLAADKSAAQRAIMTLADEGWICAAPGSPTRWQLTARILAVAHAGLRGNDLRRRARTTLESLRDQSNETVLLTVQDGHGFVVLDVVESRQMLRAVPHVGMAVPVRGSATSRAMLPFMDEQRCMQILGEPPDPALLEEFAATRRRGYSVSKGEIAADSTTIAAPILEVDGQPCAAVAITAPSTRLTAAQHRTIGTMLFDAARALSQAPQKPYDYAVGSD
jgi:DNA-binding IclR family transcriptional regulator